MNRFDHGTVQKKKMYGQNGVNLKLFILSDNLNGKLCVLILKIVAVSTITISPDPKNILVYVTSHFTLRKEK